jgi:hypothetical protein
VGIEKQCANINPANAAPKIAGILRVAHHNHRDSAVVIVETIRLSAQ